MIVVGVLDLMGGLAVRARGGRRHAYAPVSAVAGSAIPAGDVVALARAYVDLGVDALYVADLDAIMRGEPQDAQVARLASLNVPLWVDAGVTSLDAAARVRGLGADRVIVGLETLAAFGDLEAISRALGTAHVVFSLDLRNGVPLALPADGAGSPEALAARAVEAGAGAVVVLDLARVGSGAGLDLALMARVRTAAPAVPLLAGGGVRDAGDLDALARAGCDGALVASALLDGVLQLQRKRIPAETGAAPAQRGL